MTRKTTSRQEDAAQLEQLQNDLRKLVRTKRQKVLPADFPALLRAERVRSEAKRLGLSLDRRDDFLEVLRKILKGRAEEEEQAASSERFPAGTLDDWGKFRVAEPALALLGLTPATRSKGREGRRCEAARSRGRAKPVVGRTIRNDNHEPVILEEVALLLAPDTGSPPVEASAVTLEAFRQQPLPDFAQATCNLSKSEIRRLAVEYVCSFREFHCELEELWRAVHPMTVPTTEPAEIEREVFFSSLHAFADRRLDNEYLMHFAFALHQAEKDTPWGRFRWLAWVLDALHFHLLPFSSRGWALLNHATERAAGNFHVFLETMESTQFGRDTLQVWADQFEPQSYEPVEPSHAHYVWLTGLTAAQLLIVPRELSEAERKAVVRWIFDNGTDSDADEIAKLMQPASKPTRQRRDDTNDVAFLKSLHHLTRQRKNIYTKLLIT